jgi:hypothetical protein
MKTDIEILREMFKESAIEAVFKQKGKQKGEKNRLILGEDNQNYKVTILGMPEEKQVIIIKSDKFENPQAVFKGNYGECKRSDYAIVVEDDERKVIIYVELKSRGTTSSEKNVINQLLGSECFIFYCQKIGQLFWQKSNFLDGYSTRFVRFANSPSIRKTTTRVDKKQNNDRPERMLKIDFGEYHLKRLIGS